MASAHQEELKHAVHVLSCWNGECKRYLDRLVQLLEERGVKCISQARGDYGLGGLFADRFTHFFTSCGRTIIHICPESIEMVNDFEQVLLDAAEKTSFFRIPSSPSDYSRFIKQFNVWDLSDEPVLKRFIKEISRKESHSLNLPEAYSELPLPLSSQDRYRVSPKAFKAVSFIHRGAAYPVMYVDESFLLLSSAEEYIRKSIQENANPESCLDYSKENPDVLFFILNEVMPDLYNQGQITRLAQLTRSHQPLLRDRALRYVQLLVLLNREQPFSVSDMRETESSLFNLFSDAETLHVDGALVSVIVTYLMALVSYIMACHSEGNDDECDRHLNVITHRELFKKARSKKLKRKYAIQGSGVLVEVMQSCVRCWQRQNCKELNSKIISTASCSSSKTKQPPSKELQLLLLVSSLIQINKDGNFASYSHHLPQLSLEYRTRGSQSKPFEILLANISICGMRTFLENRTKELATTSNISECCNQAMNILSESLLILDEYDRPQLLRQLTTLFFHHNSDIRKESTKLYNENKTIPMTYILWKNLLMTSEDLLSPLMKNASTDYSFPFHVHWGWTVIKQDLSYEGNRVLMHVLCPTNKEHDEGVRCNPKDERFNELRLLKDLQHPHVVQLQAYSEILWPQFYITEDYMIEALQTLLVNKSRKNNFYSLKKLLMFLVDAIEGVRYLHSNNIVHRHLTAAHLFISTSGQIKLSGLMHARKLSEDTIRDFNCSLIPTRWSAPESLKECLFSKMSDMWMVGHVIYEILTHGRLPYADIGLDDTEVIPGVVDGKRTLCKEACIPKSVYQVISQLTRTQPSSRLSEVKAVIDVLQSQVEQIHEVEKIMRFPDIRGEGQAATEHGKGPIASVLNTYFGASGGLYGNEDNVVLKIVSPNRQGHSRGLRHIREVCQEDFSTCVFSFLTTCHLSGISPLISHPRTTSEGKREVSFWLPSEHDIRSLANAVHLMWLGNDIKQYIQCLGNIAAAITDLHSHGLVLCDFCADTIYIEKEPTHTGQITKVWLGSLANIRILQPGVEKEDQHIKISPPRDSELCRRAAPEVLKDGLYTQGSDVFCFGRLMFWVINTFCETKAEDPFTQPDSEIYHKIEDIPYSSLKERPQATAGHIYSLIKWCCNPEKCERPSIHVVEKHLTCTEGQLFTEIGHENAEGDDIVQYEDKDKHSSNSSGYASSYRTITESEDGSAESISSMTSPQLFLPRLSSEPPPLPSRRRVTSSLSPRSSQEMNAHLSPEFSPPPYPPPRLKESTTPFSSPPSPPPRPPRRTLSTIPRRSLSPRLSTPPGIPTTRQLSQTDQSPPPLPPRKKAVFQSSSLPSLLERALDEPSSAHAQQLSSKNLEAPLSPSSLQALSVTPSSSVVEDPDSSSWPGTLPSCKNENLERKWLSETEISENSSRKIRRKTRSKLDSIKEFTYDVADSTCDTIHVKDIAERSGATLKMQTSFDPGMKSLVLRGTRGQIQEALRIITIRKGKKEEIINTTKAFWVEWVEKAFPDLEKRTYFVPPIWMARVPMVKKTFAGLEMFMLVQGNTQDNAVAQDLKQACIQRSDVLDDDAFQRVLFTLKTFSKVYQEIFMCLSQLPFGSYLGNPRFFPATAHLPLPNNLPETWPISWRQGDFDVLLIHKQYGFVVCEVKAMAYNTETSKEDRGKQITKTLNNARVQLDKAEAMLSHLVSDVIANMRITKTIICPNLTSREIQEIINDNQQLQQDLFQCFKLKKSADVAGMIICSDHLSDLEPWRSVTAEKVKKLSEWWKAFVAEPGYDTRMNTSPDVYKNVIARFCGPASTVTVPCITEPRVSIKTLGQAVSHVGDCYTAHITLFPEQIELLNRVPPRVFIAGPPGTGKTTVLLLMAAEWLRHGNDVYVLSTWDASLAATFMLYRLLQEILKKHLVNVPTPGQIFIKILKGKDDHILVLDDLTQVASKGCVYIIADEVGPDHGPESHIFLEFCTQLTDRFRNQNAVLNLWAASCFHKQALAQQDHKVGWELQSFTRPLRSPPSVIQEIKKAVEIKNQTVQEYTERGVPNFTDGPAVHWIIHHSQTHSCQNVEDCNICGKVVAKFLHNELLLGVSSTSDTMTSGTFHSFSASRTAESLKYRDVFILSLLELREDAPILRALSNANIPVRVMSARDIEDVATAESDVVWAARQHLVRGLERKVVVCLVNETDEKNPYAFTRLFAMSRCSSQLVVVCPPS